MLVVVVGSDNEDGVRAEACCNGDRLLCVVRRARRVWQDHHRQDSGVNRILRRAGNRQLPLTARSLVYNLLAYGLSDQSFNSLMRRLKPHSNGPLYSTTVIGTLAVGGWAVPFGTARRVLSELRPRPVPSLLYQMYHQRLVDQLHIIRCSTIITCAR